MVALSKENEYGSYRTMIAQTMVQPSSRIESGIQLQKVRGLQLFNFTEELQTRFEILIEGQK